MTIKIRLTATPTISVIRLASVTRSSCKAVLDPAAGLGRQYLLVPPSPQEQVPSRVPAPFRGLALSLASSRTCKPQPSPPPCSHVRQAARRLTRSDDLAFPVPTEVPRHYRRLRNCAELSQSSYLGCSAGSTPTTN